MASGSTSLLASIKSSDFSALRSLFFLSGATPFDKFTFSFQDALRPTVSPWNADLDHNPIYLFSDGCEFGNSQNCTNLCQDKNAAFSNLNTFHNCMAYPTIARLDAIGNFSTNSNDSDLVDLLKIQKSQQGSDLLNTITDVMQSCLRSYCNQSSACEISSEMETPTVLNSTSEFFLPSNYTELDDPDVENDPFAIAYDLCGYQSANLNPDVGGIGVYVSYWIQLGLSVFGSLSVLWWGWGLYLCSFLVYSSQNGHKIAKEKAGKLVAKLGNKHLPSTISALTDFQKAQCFFMLAINIAAQVNRGKGGFQPTSLQQLYNNYIFIKAISISGYLPITFTLFTLHTVDMVSWYLIGLSICTVAISTATLVDIKSFAPSQTDMDYLVNQTHTGGTPDCGNQNLLVYCLYPIGSYDGEEYDSYDYGNLDPSAGAYSILCFCLLVLILLTLDQATVFKKLSSLQTNPLLSKSQNFLISNFLGIRGIQLALTALSWAPQAWEMPPYSLGFTMCLLYIFITSDLHYAPRNNLAGKAFNVWLVLIADLLSCGMGLAYLISYSNNWGSYSSYWGIGIFLGVFIWLSFTLTLILTTRHIRSSRKARLPKQKARRQCPVPMRRLSSLISPGWRSMGTVLFHTRSQFLKSNTNRLKRNLKSAADVGDWAAKLRAVTIFILYTAFFGFYLYWFSVYSQVLSWFALYVDSTTWTFGQIVAITVWAQPLCEYFHLELRGIRRGFQHRLIWPYKVIDVTEDIEEARETMATPIAADSQQERHEERCSYEMLTRAGGESVTVDSPSMRGRVSQDANEGDSPQAFDMPARKPVSLDHLRNTSGTSFDAPTPEERDVSHEEWQIPESVLMISNESTFH